MGDANQVRAQGIATWRQVREQPLRLGYHNPWRRYALLGAAIIGASATVRVLWGTAARPVLLLFGIGAAFCLIAAYRTLAGERRVGGLIAEVSAETLAIGCGRDRLAIPWSAIDLDRSSVIDHGLLALPVRRMNLASLAIVSADGATRGWTREDYRRFILDAHWNGDQARLEIRSDPSEFVVHLMMLVQPMLAVMHEEALARDGAVEAVSTLTPS